MARKYTTAQFAEAFIAEANRLDRDGRNVEPGSPDDEDLDLFFNADRNKIYLSNNCPGFSPYLFLGSRPDGEPEAVVAAAVNSSQDGQISTEVEILASAPIPGDDLDAAVTAAIRCWHSTL